MALSLECMRVDENPFEIADREREKVQQLESRIEALERSNSLLMQSVTMMMKMCNEKIKKAP